MNRLGRTLNQEIAHIVGWPTYDARFVWVGYGTGLRALAASFVVVVRVVAGCGRHGSTWRGFLGVGVFTSYLLAAIEILNVKFQSNYHTYQY
ncbi:Uncharacterized protein TCM_035696 [Theobroma cacao]|uniref:Uncharacterized protein n=1 Tax=Theobroma cacao TaxID=3641 RepID=A0A061FJF9_THECC|nr:Uncharacterized protein TCM_035696 [Theobroma cacao]